jgi:hypothetical protein
LKKSSIPDCFSYLAFSLAESPWNFNRVPHEHCSSRTRRKYYEHLMMLLLKNALLTSFLFRSRRSKNSCLSKKCFLSFTIKNETPHGRVWFFMVKERPSHSDILMWCGSYKTYLKTDVRLLAIGAFI